MLEKKSKMSFRHQCILLGLCRSTLYYTPATESEENLKIMEMLDKQYTDTPFYGRRRLQNWLRTQGHYVNKKRLSRLMDLTRWRTLYPKIKTTKADIKAYKYPYLLNGYEITKSNQVWEIDISYLPMRKGFMYLFAIIDVYSRYVISWSISNTMTSEWCVSVLKDAFYNYGTPETINSDQGSQFTAENYVNLLKNNNIKISMDSRGRALDNIFIERLWRSVKQEYVYLNPCRTGDELWRGLNNYFNFYNNERLHQSLDYKIPKLIYENTKKVV